MNGIKAGQHAGVRPWHAFACGSMLGLAALYERVRGLRDGRQYVLCHSSSTLDHVTVVALVLVAGAFLAAVVGGVTAVMREKPSPPAFLVACMVAALAFVVAADRVDAGGERRAAQLASAPFDEALCDYPAPVYSATPGWFSW
ncbi:hypothetical protein [Streptomyces mangrovisoli]|uniref:Uncharacterized protein n=1 Tax=Streptomyces mangrovisoli TaxID=1428628 RepID=A0A1J4P5V8_9ACTN|nr:hypothetical protein [Streptomyces mangrovisoli]OIJ69148.1 hypothetical protein WN71_004230 [Streptomyces mangrovisoli]